MATNTISTYSSTGIQLTTAGAYQSPFTVTSDGTIHATGPTTTLGSDGIYSSLGGASVLNLGTIYGANVGVSLNSGGTVTNAAGGTISGGYVGVAVANAAGDVTNAGTITGTAQFGVYLGLGGSLTNSGIIAGGYYALVALAAATIANTGTISGTAGSGAYMKGGTLTNTGTISGAAKSGIFVAGGSVLNTASYSLIAGAKYGLVAEDAAVTVTNTGTIAGGSQEGIFLEGGVIINSESYSRISGSTDGIISEAGSSSTIFNAGTITGASVDGVYLGEGGTITNTGTITGATLDGVYLDDGGTITNTGTASAIYGSAFGVEIRGAAGAITNAGSIGASSGTGVRLIEGGIVTNTGAITGAETGVYFKYSGGTLINAASGVITGQAGVRLGNSGFFHTFFDAPQSLNNAGLIAGTTDGIFVYGYPASTVINSGTVSAIGSGSGMYFEGGGYIGNSGTFSGGDGVKLADYPGNFAYALTLDNTGTLFGTGTGLSASDAGGGNETITNANLIYGAAEGISISNNGAAYVSVINTGSIAGGNHGVYIVNSGTVTNAASGTITGGEAVRLGNGGGIANTGTASQSLNNAGLIAGSENGVFIRGSLSSLINTGTISGPGSALYFLGGGSIANAGTFSGGYGAHLVDDQGIALTFSNTGSLLATGRALDAGGAGNQTLINQGLIDGEFIGVVLSDSGTALDTLINAGTILSQNFGVLVDTFGNTAIFNQGTIEDGVRLQDSGTNTDFLLNSGSINGFTGVEVYTTGGSQTIINRGIISGENGLLLGASAASGTTIENAGTIAGAFGTAIGTLATNAGELTLIVDPGAVFIGNVEAAAVAANTLELGAGSGSLSGIGTQFTNFDALIVETGAAWTLSAANTLAGAPGIPGPYPLGGSGSGVVLAAGAYLATAGTITGGAGGAGSGSTPGANGGNGAVLQSDATLVNSGTLSGGSGGYGSSYGGQGGAGALILASASLANSGSISGGGGGGSGKIGGGGGFGVFIEGGASLANEGRISGGAGDSNGITAYDGATGVYLSAGGSLTNAASGTILGGDGGASTIGKGGGIALDLATQFITYSGVVTLISAASLSNFGQIIGGNGGYGNDGGDGGGGGTGIRVDTFGTVANQGTIAGGSGANGGNYAGSGGYGLGLDPFATLDNLGVIEGATGGNGRVSGYGGNGVIVRSKDAVILNQQNISGGDAGYGLQYSGAGGIGVELQSSSTLINLGTITGGKGGALAPSGIRADPGGAGVSIYAGNGSTVVNAGTISGGTGASQDGDAVLFGATASGELILTPTAVFHGAVQGSAGAGDILDLAGTTAPGTLTGFGGQFTGFDTLAFGGGTWAVAGSSFAFAAATLDGFAATDTLDVTDFSFVTDKTIKLGSSDTLAIHEGAATLDLKFTPADTGENFSISSDGAGSVLIEEVTCFLRGTRIATARGQVKVEDLEIGDLVRTVHAGFQRIKWVGTRSYAAPFCNHAKVLPIHIRAHAIGSGVPSHDLFVSPGHAICIGGALIHAARLVNGVTITQLARAEEVTYFHIELETHEIILAENCPAETFMGEYFRQQFHNAKSFAALYPGAQAPEISCLPMLTHGPQLATILRRLRARAGIFAPKIPGPLRGYIDTTTQSTISGWAADLQTPDEPVLLDILAGEKRIARVLANIPRPDVREAGYGTGNHGFEFTLPPGMTEHITVRRSADGARLAHPTRNRMNGMNRRMGEAPRAAQA